MNTDKLTREDLVNIQVALEHMIEKWQKYVEYDKNRPDDREEWLSYSQSHLSAFQTTSKKILALLKINQLPNQPTN